MVENNVHVVGIDVAQIHWLNLKEVLKVLWNDRSITKVFFDLRDDFQEMIQHGAFNLNEKDYDKFLNITKNNQISSNPEHRNELMHDKASDTLWNVSEY